MRIDTWQGDITSIAVDAVVNAANGKLRAGAGVCGAIFAAAGAEVLQAACDEVIAEHGPVDTGDAVATPAFGLPARWVVHAVGPVWHGGASGEDEALARAYRRAVAVADGLGARSIAFPAISTGVFGFPPDRGARIAVDTLRTLTPAVVERAVLVAFDDRSAARFRSLLDAG